MKKDVHPALSNRTCYHKFDLDERFCTPGTFIEIIPEICLDEIGINHNLGGLRVLDIGAWDGAFTFELSRRGAEVVALDIQDPNITIFNAVKTILNSPAEYVRASVYDLDINIHGTFDMVLFAGVYYHLKNPALSLQRIREVMKDSGIIYIEGASCSHYLVQKIHQLGNWSSAYSLLEVIDGIPLSCFDEGQQIYGHWSNWWYPTSSCLAAMLRDSGFTDVKLQLSPNAFSNYTHARISGYAKANPSKKYPREQRYEHDVYTQDYVSNRIKNELALNQIANRYRQGI